jgi:hypothetical protein
MADLFMAKETAMTVQLLDRSAIRTMPRGPGKGPGVVWLALPAAAKPCLVPGCGHPIDLSRLMCRHDWYLVPKPVRDRVWATWCSGYGVLTREHRAAVKEAIQLCQAGRLLPSDLAQRQQHNRAA